MIKFKAWNVSKTQSNRCAHGASFSRAIAKFHNAEIGHFGRNAFIHELIRGSLDKIVPDDRIDNRVRKQLTIEKIQMDETGYKPDKRLNCFNLRGQSL